ncbi:Rossmann-like and DUF2520 domain-containing protein [Nesterenkonia natronophila]|uniref:DUF2520 domain-containing protein n=1 Tax=Nesterenkonia natronophila TaxID=2174932 RepID=A0A3A4F0C7_9MICC|nr:DUF2520 domain-containing protein [Nesterenkonia natronophila]RJN31622.1 DUF2520 domain-containing protein [Nesterenkonia natronophila]
MTVPIDPYAADLPPWAREGRLGVGVISGGKVGSVLGAALRSAGHQVVGVHAVSVGSQDRAENLLPGVPVLEIPEIVRRAELVLLAVPDDVLGKLVAGAAEAGHFHPGQLVVHTSGRYGTGVLKPATDAGAIGLAIHPAMTFSGMSMDLQRLNASAFAVTADPEVMPVAQALAVEMGGEPVVVEEQHRGAYHAALAHASNHLNILTAQSSEVLERIGIADPSHVLGPLMQASLDNALASGAGSLTGPVARGDAGTVRQHLRVLADSGLPADVRSAYIAMAQSAVQRALALGTLTENQAAELLDLLAE